MAKEKKEELAGELLKGLGITGLLSGLGDFLGMIKELAEKGEPLEGKKTFGGLGFQGEYRYRVSTLGEWTPRRVGIGIRPGTRYEKRYEPSTIQKPKTVEPGIEKKEPLFDVFDKGDHILVVASLPDIKEKDLEFNIEDNALKIIAKTAKGKIEKEISIPKESKVDKISSASFKHGIVEIKLSKKKEV
ncbi:MAG: Hsp20/alpha crystallin family protein [Candidatus Thermoplasmatota archaeon]